MDYGSNNDDDVPSSIFLFCDQSLVYDHWNDIWYLNEIKEKKDDVEIDDDDDDWLESTKHILQQLSKSSKKSDNQIVNERKEPKILKNKPSSAIKLDRSRSVYKQDIEDCREHIRRGESYELCLTNQLTTNIPSSMAAK